MSRLSSALRLRCGSNPSKINSIDVNISAPVSSPSKLAKLISVARRSSGDVNAAGSKAGRRNCPPSTAANAIPQSTSRIPNVAGR